MSTSSTAGNNGNQPDRTGNGASTTKTTTNPGPQASTTKTTTAPDAEPVTPGTGGTSKTTTSTPTISVDAAPPGVATSTTAGVGAATESNRLPSTSALQSGSSSNQTASTPAITGSDEDMGYSTGALVGAIIGTLIGAVIITFVITWFVARKRSDRNSSSAKHRSSRSPSRHQSVKGAGAGVVSEKPTSKSANAGLGWQAYLPQSADDRTIQSAVKTLFDQIELHVDNYYTRANVEINSNIHQALSQVDSTRLPGPIDDLMLNSRTALPVIKHCFANLLIARISPSSNAGRSLLPAYLSVMPSKLEASSMPAGETTAVQQAYSQWKLLNAYLHPRPEENQDYLHRRDYTADEMDEQLSTAFWPWQVPTESAEALKQHEKSLINRAGSVGVLIMSQPSAYEFRWSAGQETSRNTSNRSLIVMPGFWKTTDEQGHPLEHSQLLVSPVQLRV